MKRSFLLIGFMYLALLVSAEESFNPQLSSLHLDDIILDIYNAASEFGDPDFEQLQTDLYTLHDHPIDLNHTNEEELQQLYFLSPRQIDAILAHADQHPFEELYELRLLPSLTDYEIRNLLPFVRVSANAPDKTMYTREVFKLASHEVIARADVRDMEQFEGTDPVFAQLRYRFDYRRRVVFGGQLRRPVGGKAKDIEYGLYVQLKDVSKHLHTVVGGNYQASFGQGLVLAPVFHKGKSMYVASAGQQSNGLRYYSSADGKGLHGAGATLRWEWGKSTRLDVTALYSMRRANDSIWQHTVGANITVRHKRLEVQLTAIDNIWSDSIRPYNNARYNHHYFRGYNQAVIGASARYNHGWFDAFAEVATAQNYQRFAETLNGRYPQPLNSPRWGVGVLAGSRFYPADGVSLVALYRYYSPFFDNQWGYGFSETSRINDEHGGYLGFDITRLNHWRFSGYGDVFFFEGIKYGLGSDTCTLGYDALADIQYIRQNWRIDMRFRARKKGGTSTYSARAQFEWSRGGWSLRTTADANLVQKQSPITNDQSPIPYGVSLAQDIAYDFQLSSFRLPLSLRLRLQGFDTRQWDNRIYIYEHDVLYAFSIPATYGLGGRAYLCLRWQILKQLTLYLRVSETVYARDWYVEKHPKSVFAEHPSRIPTKTDIHVLLRVKL